MDGADSKIDIFNEKVQIRRKPSPGRFARTPYYSSSRGLANLLYELLKQFLFRNAYFVDDLN